MVNNIPDNINAVLNHLILLIDKSVLSQATDSKIPLLERVRFLSIAFSNLDEFFMVRVAGLNVQKFSRIKSFDGLTPQQQLKLIDKETSKSLDIYI